MSAWNNILALDFTGAPRKSWDAIGTGCGFLVRALTRTGDTAKFVSCPLCGCCHEVMPNNGEGDLIAVCRCKPPTCDDMTITREEAHLWAVDVAKLAPLLTTVLPITPRLEQIGETAAWYVGDTSLRTDGKDVALVICLSMNGNSIHNAAMQVKPSGLERTIFVCTTKKQKTVEALLPAGSRVIGFDEMWALDNGAVSPARSARRLLAGWPDESQVRSENASTTCGGYYFKARGIKNTRVDKKSYKLTTWRCIMESRSIDLPEILGSELLVRILLQRGKEIYADKLMRSLTGEAVDVVDKSNLEWLSNKRTQSGTARSSPDTRQEVLGKDDIAEAQARIKELQEQISECDAYPAYAGEKAKLEETLDAELKYLKGATRPGPKGKFVPKVFDNSLSQAGNLVGKHIRAALAGIKEIDNGLWVHLYNKDILKFGQVCLYSSESGYKWRQK